MSLNSKLNWLRAGVLGANDGIVSVAGTIIGVMGATNETTLILAAGTATLIAGAFSMAGGEYVSVASQRDTEKAILTKEKQSLQENPSEEFNELIGLYEQKGLTIKTATQVAKELSTKNFNKTLEAHAETEHKILVNDLTNPYHAAISSFLSFTAGALIPLISVLIYPHITATIIAILIALTVTAVISSKIGKHQPWKPLLRNITIGVLTTIFTYFTGILFGI